jgi:hypothetical protein
MAHSLDAAQAIGVISKEATFVGLQKTDIARLFDAGYCDQPLLIRIRSANGDSRLVQNVREFIEEAPLLDSKGRVWDREDIRDVYPLPDTLDSPL